MEIGLLHDGTIWYIGPIELLTAWFATISANLEHNGWGCRYPTLMKKFYVGELSSENANSALEELKQIRQHLKNAPPSQIIWAPQDFKMAPPEGTSVWLAAPNISEAFLNPRGRNLFDTLTKAFEDLRDCGGVARIVRMPTRFAVTIDGTTESDPEAH